VVRKGFAFPLDESYKRFGEFSIVRVPISLSLPNLNLSFLVSDCGYAGYRCAQALLIQRYLLFQSNLE
jgi:hypothetical protein